MVSIIVPIYNAENFLEECLRSIQNQDYSDFEVLCVNDGSPDNSSSIVEKFVEADNRFILINQTNGGVSKARNTALLNAKGDYVCFVDSDDVISNDFLTTLLRLSSDGSFAVCGYTRNIEELGNTGEGVSFYSAKDYIRHVFDESIEHPNICMMLFKNSIIQMQHLDFTIGCVRNEDTEFYTRYLMYESKVAYSDKKCYFYRVNLGSAMHVTTKRSFTSLEASKRIGFILKENGIYDNEYIDLHSNVQGMTYHISREHNLNMYNYLHDKYDVKNAMFALLKHPSLRRRVVAAFYLCCGRTLFYKLVSSKIADILPL